MSTPLKRYRCVELHYEDEGIVAEMREREDGAYVLHENVRRLEQSHARLLGALENLVDTYGDRFEGTGPGKLFGPFDEEIIAARLVIAAAEEIK